jgi:hypothetical protein
MPVREEIISNPARAVTPRSAVPSPLNSFLFNRHNGYEHDCPDRMDPSRPLWISWVRHYGHLLGGHWLSTCLVSVVAFAPERLRTAVIDRGFPGTDSDLAAIRRAALKWFGNHDRILRIRARLAGWASFLVRNHNLHRVHRKRPDIPWRAIPTAFSGNPVPRTAAVI